MGNKRAIFPYYLFLYRLLRTSHGQVEPKVPKSLILFFGHTGGFFPKGCLENRLEKKAFCVGDTVHTTTKKPLLIRMAREYVSDFALHDVKYLNWNWNWC